MYILSYLKFIYIDTAILLIANTSILKFNIFKNDIGIFIKSIFYFI